MVLEQATVWTPASIKYKGGPMATKELQILRLRFKAAYTTYMNCVQEISEASMQGQWPTEARLKADEAALKELVAAHAALLAGLWDHTQKKKAV
jgi:hypothetical protein